MVGSRIVNVEETEAVGDTFINSLLKELRLREPAIPIIENPT